MIRIVLQTDLAFRNERFTVDLPSLNHRLLVIHYLLLSERAGGRAGAVGQPAFGAEAVGVRRRLGAVPRGHGHAPPEVQLHVRRLRLGQRLQRQSGQFR